MRRVFLIGLNEFNRDLLRTAAERAGLRNIGKLFTLRVLSTRTNDTYESDHLEPWVQWVSVHAGLPSGAHRIKHLGDVPSLQHPQIWERLSARGISSMVWGALNAARAGAARCEMFIPDPWVASEEAHPADYGPILKFLRYACRNRLDHSKVTFAGLALRYLWAIGTPSVWAALLRKMPAFVAMSLRYPGAEFVGYTLVEYLNGLYFLKAAKKSGTRFNFLFLNAVAHVQHYHWNAPPAGLSRPVRYVMGFLDDLLGHVFATVHKDDLLYVANALSQENTADEAPWIAYRPRNIASFLARLDIRKVTVNPLMSYDALLFFETAQEASAAAAELASGVMNGKPLLVVEKDAGRPEKVFFRLAYTDPVPPGSVCTFRSGTLVFDEWFEALTTRTGKHASTGTVFTNDTKLPDALYNHELSGHFESVLTA